MDLDRLRRQDAEEFTRLVDSHQSIVLGLGQSLGLRGADLDDAAAESFAAVYRALPKFEGKSEIGTWVYRIAYRVIIKARHKRNRNSTVEMPEQAMPSDAPGPNENAERSETAAAVWAAVESLDDRQASAVELYYRREWPLEKIAAVLECPVGTVKTLLYRAREKLRHLLASLEVQS